jgi:hypothetical protein
MAFGQQSGPPASAKQVRELLDLLKGPGHSDFRDARGPMGFTQRPVAGKFSRDEAAAFIAQLLDAESDRTLAIAAPTWRQSAQEQMLSSLPRNSSPASFVVADGLPPSPKAGVGGTLAT